MGAQREYNPPNLPNSWTTRVIGINGSTEPPLGRDTLP
jgi:hypothetical protein